MAGVRAGPGAGADCGGWLTVGGSWIAVKVETHGLRRQYYVSRRRAEKEGPFVRVLKQGGDDLRLGLDPELPIDRRVSPVVELNCIPTLDPLDSETRIGVDQRQPIGGAAHGDRLAAPDLGREDVAEIGAADIHPWSSAEAGEDKRTQPHGDQQGDAKSNRGS